MGEVKATIPTINFDENNIAMSFAVLSDLHLHQSSNAVTANVQRQVHRYANTVAALNQLSKNNSGEGIDLLLETIVATAEMQNLKANPNRYALGTVIEEKLDKNIGGVASLIIQNGTLRLGDPIVVGTTYGKVRTMKSDTGESIVEAGPSTPVSITGLSGNPAAGDKFMAFETESEAKEIAEKESMETLFDQQRTGLRRMVRAGDRQYQADYAGR
jgi:translation initiation factor IF-2